MTFARKMIRWKHDRQWKFDNNMPDFMEGWIDMDQIKWVRNEMPKTDDKQLAVMSLENVAKARAFHESFPQYAVTPLAGLSGMAKHLGISGVYVKDESYRFGLNAFKVLGGSFAMANYIAEELGRDVSEITTII